MNNEQWALLTEISQEAHGRPSWLGYQQAGWPPSQKRWAMHHPCCVVFVFGPVGSFNFIMENCVIIKLKKLLLSDLFRIQEWPSFRWPQEINKGTLKEQKQTELKLPKCNDIFGGSLHLILAVQRVPPFERYTPPLEIKPQGPCTRTFPSWVRWAARTIGIKVFWLTS